MLRKASMVLQEVPGDGSCALWSFLLGFGLVGRKSFTPFISHIDDRVIFQSPLDNVPIASRGSELVFKMRELREQVVQWMLNPRHLPLFRSESEFFSSGGNLNVNEVMSYSTDRRVTEKVHFFALAKIYSVDIVLIVQMFNFLARKSIQEWADQCQLISCEMNTCEEVVLCSWANDLVPRLLSRDQGLSKLVVLVWNGRSDEFGHYNVALFNSTIARISSFQKSECPTYSTHNHVPVTPVSKVCKPHKTRNASLTQTKTTSEGTKSKVRKKSAYQRVSRSSKGYNPSRSPRVVLTFPVDNEEDQPSLNAVSEDHNVLEASSHACEHLLHPNENVRAAMLAFGRSDMLHQMGVCGICFETRIIGNDATNSMNQKLFSTTHKLNVKWWKLVDGHKYGCDKICERCLKVCKKMKNGVAHPFSGCLSTGSQLSSSGHHNNLHFRPVSSYLANLTEFEISCVAKFTMATSIHIVGNGFGQRGCVAHLPSRFRVANALPWLPREIDVLIVYQEGKSSLSSNEKAQKMYGVRRGLLEQALQGLLYGVPKGGYVLPPDNDHTYEKYLYNDHEDGTVLNGRYFLASHLPNPAYWNVKSSCERLMAYNLEYSVPDGLSIVCARGHQIQGSTNNEDERDVNDNDTQGEQNEHSDSTLAQHLDIALRNGYVSHLDDVVTIIGHEDDDVTKKIIFETLVASVGEDAAKQYSLSGHGVSVARLHTLPRAEIINPWQTEGFWSGLAPRVFSGGGGDITLSTECLLPSNKRLQVSLYFEHLVWANTNRFVQHPLLPILAARMLMQEQSQRQASFGIRQVLGSSFLSEDIIRERMEAGDEDIFNMLFSLQGNVTNTAGYWNRFNKEVKAGLLDVAYIEQQEKEALPPTLIFNSQSCAEYWWPTLKKLVVQINSTTEAPLEMMGIPNDAESSGQIAMYSALRRFPHIVGAYFDWRTCNFHNTVGRALGIDDVWLRYEFGSNKGHLHSHAVGVSTSMSCMVNRARADAEKIINEMDDEENCTTTSAFKECFADTIFEGLAGHTYDNVGQTASHDGYQSWCWQSRHSSSQFDSGDQRWVAHPECWTEPLKRWKRGQTHPSSKTMDEMIASIDAYRQFCVDQDNSSYQHRCTSYCMRLLPHKQRSNDVDKPFYRCRFGFAKLNLNKEVVITRPPHDDPRFVKVNGQWRFEAPVDNWRTLPKPLACRVWSANESCFPIIIPEPRDVADAQILPIADYVADYANKATDNIEIARNMFQNLVSAQKNLRVVATTESPVADELVADENSAMASEINHMPKVQTLASFLHSAMQRLAGLPVLTHLQSVMTLSGTPLHRSTRQSKTVSLSKNRLLSKRKRAAKNLEEPHDLFVQDADLIAVSDEIEQQDSEEFRSTLERFFAFRLKNNGVDEVGQPLSLYRWLKKVQRGNTPPIIFPTGVHQLNFTWPLNESWARSMLLLHLETPWLTDADALGQSNNFHDALLAFCNLKEADNNLVTINAESDVTHIKRVPYGLLRLIQSAYASHKHNKHHMAQYNLKKKRSLQQPQDDAGDVCGDECDEETKEYGSSMQQMLRDFYQHSTPDHQSNDINADSTGIPMFDPPPPEYDFHMRGRQDLLNALQQMDTQLDKLEPPLPAPNTEFNFECTLGKVVQNLAAQTSAHGLEKDDLQPSMLLKASISQRVAIVHMILPMLQRRLHNDHAINALPAHLKLLGEAGSGKSMVLNAIQRIVQRLNGSAKAVMSLAPTGAVAISMGKNGSTIQNVIQAFRLSNVSKRKHNQNCLHEQDMQLNDCKLAKLRARLGFDPVTGKCVTKCIVIDEISMVGASLFWAIHCRLCQALEKDDVRSVNNGFANMDIAVIGDFGQLDPVCATSLVSNSSKAKGLNASGIQLFHNIFTDQVVFLESQHRLNLHNEQNVHLRRLQLNARDGKLDDIDFTYIKSLDLNRKTDKEKKLFLAHRVLHVHFYVRDVILGNIAEVKQVSTNQDCFPSILLNKTKGGRCSNIEGDVNQLPPMGMFVKSLHVLCTVNGLGYPQLTNILGVANGTRGTVVAVLHTHSTLPEPDVVVIVDFPTYAGPSLIGKGWPTTWIPVSNVTRRCEQGCCERTGIPLAPASHITLFKCQGLTCGNGQQHEKMLLYCNNIQSAESKWPRSLYVALTRTIDASDLALVNYGEFKKELWNLINEAKYHEHNETRKTHDVHISRQLQEKYAEYITDDGWLHFLSLIDELACDGISDATCSTRDTFKCANSGCLSCRKLFTR